MWESDGMLVFGAHPFFCFRLLPPACFKVCIMKERIKKYFI